MRDKFGTYYQYATGSITGSYILQWQEKSEETLPGQMNLEDYLEAIHDTN